MQAEPGRIYIPHLSTIGGMKFRKARIIFLWWITKWMVGLFSLETMTDLSPMMQHYLTAKEQYPDALLFYRLGDFYEMFFDDAKIVSRELDLVLTGKNAGVPERVPMCGVPHHAVSGYVQRLTQRGYKIAIAE